jgi:hypothetical protein
MHPHFLDLGTNWGYGLCIKLDHDFFFSCPSLFVVKSCIIVADFSKNLSVTICKVKSVNSRGLAFIDHEHQIKAIRCNGFVRNISGSMEKIANYFCGMV